MVTITPLPENPNLLKENIKIRWKKNTPNLAHCQVVPVGQTHVRARIYIKEYA
jgi:hypothetical protein